jgi:hypothetical protein
VDADAAVMSDTLELQDVAARVIAATEYFKSAGHLPSWARAELDPSDREASAYERRTSLRPADSPVLTGTCAFS